MESNIEVFKKLEIVEEMTETKYKAMTDPYIYSKMTSNTDVAPSVQPVNAKIKLRTIILKKLKDFKISQYEYDSMSYDTLREYMVKMIYEDMNMIGSDTRRIANKFGIDLKTLINEELERALNK